MHAHTQAYIRTLHFLTYLAAGLVKDFMAAFLELFFFYIFFFLHVCSLFFSPSFLSYLGPTFGRTFDPTLYFLFIGSSYVVRGH